MNDAPLPRRLSYLLGVLYREVLDAETRALDPLGVTVKQHGVLALLVDEGPMTQQRLGERLGIDRTTIVKVVDALEGAGLVERRRSPEDRRAYLLTPTAAGSEAEAAGQGLVTKAEDEVLSVLSQSDREALAALLRRAIE